MTTSYIASTVLHLLIGIAMMAGFGFTMRMEMRKGWQYPVSAILAFFTVCFILLAGIRVGTEHERGQPLSASVIADEGLYLLQPATNLVCLVPATLNGLTALLESNGPPAYYKGVITRTNKGSVVAIRDTNAEVVLRVWPRPPEEKGSVAKKPMIVL